MLRRVISPVSFFAFVLLVTELLVGVQTVAKDPGTTWHLATGKFIFDTLSIPRLDPFLSVPRPWVSDQWLSDLIFYLVYAHYGWEGCSFFVFLVFSITLICILLPRLMAETRSVVLSSIFIFFAGKMLHVHYLIRPVIFSFLTFSLFMWELHRWHTQKLPRMWSLPLIVFLWTQLHPSCVLSFPLLLFAGTSLFIEKSPHIKKFLVCALCTVAVTFLNPYGVNLHVSILWLGQSKYFMHLHQEWRAINFFSDESFLALLVGLFGVIPYFFIRKIREKMSLMWILSTLFFLFMSFKSVRYITYLGILGAYPATISLSYFFLRLRRAKIIITKLFKVERYARKSKTFSLKLLKATVCILILWFLITGNYPLYSGECGPPKDLYPYDETRFILQTFPDSVIAASPDYGGFFAWFGGGKIKPLIDDRNTLVGEEFYKEYENAEKSFKNMIEWGRRNKANLMFIKKDSKILMNQDEAVRELFRGPIGSIYSID